MDYQKIYYQFIVDRKMKEKAIVGHSEKHHILPVSLGGDNSKDNLVRLSTEDHIRAHSLLARIYGGVMWMALCMMLVDKKAGRKVPSKMTRKFSASARENAALVAKEKALAQWSNAESRKTISEAQLKSYDCLIVRENRRKSAINNWADPILREKNIEALKKQANTPEGKAAKAQAMRNVWADNKHKIKMLNYISNLRQYCLETGVKPGKGYGKVDKELFNEWLKATNE